MKFSRTILCLSLLMNSFSFGMDYVVVEEGDKRELKNLRAPLSREDLEKHVQDMARNLMFSMVFHKCRLKKSDIKRLDRLQSTLAAVDDCWRLFARRHIDDENLPELLKQGRQVIRDRFESEKIFKRVPCLFDGYKKRFDEVTECTHVYDELVVESGKKLKGIEDLKRLLKINEKRLKRVGELKKGALGGIKTKEEISLVAGLAELEIYNRYFHDDIPATLEELAVVHEEDFEQLRNWGIDI